MENIYLGYWFFLVLLIMLFWFSYLYYKTQKSYYVLIFILLLWSTFFYYWNLFSYIFRWQWNFTWLVLGIIFWLVSIIVIWLSFFKNKNIFLWLIWIFLTIVFFKSLWNFVDLNNINESSKYTELAKYIINSKENNIDIDKNTKDNFIKLTKKVENYPWKYEMKDNFYTEKAKQIIWLYDFEYCKKTKSEECYLEFLKWKKWLEWYSTFSEKYNYFIKKYWKDINKEIIFKWLEKDLVDDINKNIKKQSVNVLEEIWIKHTSNIEIWNIIWSWKFYKNKVVVDWVNYNYFLKELYNNDKKDDNKNLSRESTNNLPKESWLIKLDIDKKRNLIKSKLNNLKKNYFNDLTYIEDFKSTWKRSDWKNTFVLYRSSIDVKIDDFNVNLTFDDWNELYIKYYADIDKYLNNSNYRNKYFENLKLLYYYFSEWDIKPYLTDIKIINLWTDMQFSYNLNRKYSNNIIISQINIEKAEENSLTILALWEIWSNWWIIQNDWKDISISIDKWLLKQEHKIAFLSDKDGKFYFIINPKLSTDIVNKFLINKPSLDLIKNNYLSWNYWTTTNSLNKQYNKIENLGSKKYNKCIRNKNIKNQKKYKCFSEYINE